MKFDLERYDDLNSYSLEDTKLEVNNPDVANRYAFLRLYNTAYDSSKISAGRILKYGNALVTGTGIDKKFYTHVGIHYGLTDDFTGLNLRPNSTNDVYIENIMSPEMETNAGAIQKDSIFSVWAYPLYENEYQNLKYALLTLREKNHIKYNVASLVKTGISDMVHRYKKYLVEKNSKEELSVKEEDDVVTFLRDHKKGLVCSTFVAWILDNISINFHRYLNKYNISVYAFAPNSITRVEGMKKLFEGNHLDYLKLTKEFVSKKPEYKAYNDKNSLLMKVDNKKLKAYKTSHENLDLLKSFYELGIEETTDGRK